MKNVLVTGGAGFIGSHFVDLLLEKEKDVQIIILDKMTYAGSHDNMEEALKDPRCIFVEGDISDDSVVKYCLYRKNIDTIVNFAAETHVDNSITGAAPFIQTNIVGVFSLLECIRETHRDIHFHQVSTDEVFGELKNNEAPWGETAPYKPNSPYSASKAAADHLVRSYGHTYGIKYTISHCTNNYGTRQHPEKLIPKVITNALSGKPIPVYGKGLQSRDWIWVLDHCEAIYNILKSSKVGETYNISGEKEVKNIDLVKTICNMLDDIALSDNQNHKKLITFVQDRPGHDNRYALDMTKYIQNFGHPNKISLRDGLYETIQWYKEKWEE